jgi:ABC-type nitrate/sulfonate/bicarbonate transport system permease component
MKAMSVAPRRWLRNGVRSASLHAAWHYLPIAIVLLVWQLVVEFDVVNRAFLPSFGETLRALWEMTRNGEIGSNLLVSVYRAFSGLAVGSIIGVAIGLAMATSRRADEFLGRWSQPPTRCRNRRWCRCSFSGSGSAMSPASYRSFSPACCP